MTETVKTSVFVAAALVIALAAFGSVYLSEPVGVAPDKEIGEPMFPGFKDPLKGASLEIVRADESVARLHRFEVEKGADGRWVIPSHGGYPADAENRIRDAATALIDLQILGVATDRPGDHELFGVLEPTEDNAGKEGVGTLVAMQDGDGDDLVRLIVGQQVKGAEDQRFVRRPNQDRVYAVRVNLDAFPAEFEQWIEKGLLKLNPLDVKRLTVKDYTAQASIDLRSGTLRPNDNRRMDLTAVEESNNWEVESLTLYRNNQPQSTGLLPEEELNETKLDDLKNALDELQIVDVRRKPQGLGADLKADKGFLNDNEGLKSLIQLGFIPAPSREGSEQKVDLYAANGEVIATQNDGVSYVLKFGNIAGAEEEGGAANLNRYLLVMARVDESMIEKPELEDLPPLPETTSEEKLQPEEKAADENGSEEKSDEDAEAKDDDEAEKADEAKAEPDLARIEAERERITKENQRKQDEYNEKLEAAKDKVRDLNNRFGDWYYVVSENVFKKLRLTRAEAIKEKAAVEEEGFGVDAFRNLEEDGLKKEEAKKEE
ncbi:MAG: DUF4340 domain-containing protein [Planctomycetes bacterium]|nr:DUF4340 domain-containing protein [Planctomycetota bacterium]